MSAPEGGLASSLSSRASGPWYTVPQEDAPPALGLPGRTRSGRASGSRGSSAAASEDEEEKDEDLQLLDDILQGRHDDEAMPLYQKIGYGFGEVGPHVAAVIYSFFLQTFLLEVAELGAFWVGILLLVGQFWDAITDPIIGHLSDRTTSAMGRRRPWLLWGAVPYAVAYFFLWQVPPWAEDGDAIAILWYLGVIFIYNSSYTCVSVPYRALTPDLTSDYDERTSLTMYRQFQALVAGVVCSFVHSTIIESTDTYKDGYLISALIFGVLIIFPPWVTFFTNKERYRPRKDELVKRSIYEHFREIAVMFKNRAFLIVTLLYLCCWLAINFITNNLFLYVKYALDMEEHFSWLLLDIQGTAAIFLFFWSYVSHKIGKVKTYYIGMTIWTVVQIGLFFFTKGVAPITIYIAGFLAGIGVSIGFLIPWAMLPDVIELDELETGKRREGMFYSVYGLFQKIGLAVGVASSSWALGLAGYEAPKSDEEDSVTTQPDSVIWTLRSMIGPFPACLLILSFIAVSFYPITRERHEEIRKQIKARKERTPSTAPGQPATPSSS